MNKAEKREQRRRRSTRQLMGIDRLTGHGAVTPEGELVFFLLQPDNLSVLPAEGVRSRIRAMTNLLRGQRHIILRAVDSRESYARNQSWYQHRHEEEQNPAIQRLLRLDRAYLDEIQTLSAASREFLLVFPLPSGGNERPEVSIQRLAKEITDCGFRVRVAEDQDVKRLLAVYYQHDVTTERHGNFDGEGVIGHGE